MSWLSVCQKMVGRCWRGVGGVGGVGEERQNLKAHSRICVAAEKEGLRLVNRRSLECTFLGSRHAEIPRRSISTILLLLLRSFSGRGIERLSKTCRLDSSQTSQEYRLQAQSADLPSHGLTEPLLRPTSTSTSTPTRSEIKLPPWRYQHQRRQKSHPPRPSAHWPPSIISS